MSIRALNAVWERGASAGVTGNSLVILLALADHADDDGWCWPSQIRLARRCGVSTDTVSRVVARLAQDGVLHVERKAGIVNRYRLAWLAPEAEADAIFATAQVIHNHPQVAGGDQPQNAGTPPAEPCGQTTRTAMRREPSRTSKNLQGAGVEKAEKAAITDEERARVAALLQRHRR